MEKLINNYYTNMHLNVPSLQEHIARVQKQMDKKIINIIAKHMDETGIPYATMEPFRTKDVMNYAILHLEHAIYQNPLDDKTMVAGFLRVKVTDEILAEYRMERTASEIITIITEPKVGKAVDEPNFHGINPVLRHKELMALYPAGDMFWGFDIVEHAEHFASYLTSGKATDIYNRQFNKSRVKVNEGQYSHMVPLVKYFNIPKTQAEFRSTVGSLLVRMGSYFTQLVADGYLGYGVASKALICYDQKYEGKGCIILIGYVGEQYLSVFQSKITLAVFNQKLVKLSEGFFLGCDQNFGTK